jgi:ubiquinone biosynthesis protein COQ9
VPQHTDRKEAEKKIQQSRRTLQQIIEFLPEATFVNDAEKKSSHEPRA